MKKQHTWLVILIMGLIMSGCGKDTSLSTLPAIVVNSLEDLENPSKGTVTLRSALAMAANGQSIEFDTNLDGGTIELSLIGEDHTVLKGEVMGMKMEPSGPVSYLEGYFSRLREVGVICPKERRY